MSDIIDEPATAPRIRKRIFIKPSAASETTPAEQDLSTETGGGASKDPPQPPAAAPAADEPAPRKRGPNQTSFKPGVSGNPKGRPKGAKGMNAMSKKALAQKTTVRTKTGSKKIMVIEALIQKELERAVQGDRFARKNMFEMARLVFAETAPASTNGAAAPVDFGAAGQAVLDWFAGEVLAGNVAPGGAGSGGEGQSDAGQDEEGGEQ